MFRAPRFIAGVLAILVTSCDPTGLPGVVPGDGDGGPAEPTSDLGDIRARIRNESSAQADVTIRFLFDDDVANLAFVRVPPDTITTLQGPRAEAVEVSGVNDRGEALPAALLRYGFDFDEAHAAEYLINDSGAGPGPSHPTPPWLELEAVEGDFALGEAISITWSDRGSPAAVVTLFLRAAGNEDGILTPLGPAVGVALDGLNDTLRAVIEGVEPGEYVVVGRVDDLDQSLTAVAPGGIRVTRDPKNAAPTIALRDTGPMVIRNGETTQFEWSDSDADDNATITLTLSSSGTDPLSAQEYVISPPMAEDPDNSGDVAVVTLHGVLPGLYDLVARIDDGRLAGTDRLAEAVRVVPSTANDLPRMDLLEPVDDIEVQAGEAFDARWTDSDGNDNARIILLLDLDPGNSLLNGNEIVLANGIDEDPDGAADRISLLVPITVPGGAYRLVTVITDGLTQVITRAPGLVTVLGASGGGGDTDGDGGGGEKVTVVPSVHVVDTPGQLIHVAVNLDVSPLPRRSRVFLSNLAYGGGFRLDVTPATGPSPSTKSYTVVVDTGLVPNATWPRSFDVELETQFDDVITTTVSDRPIWIRQEVEILTVRALNYRCSVDDPLITDPSDFVGIEWTWYGGGFEETGPQLSAAFWLTPDGMVSEDLVDDSTHKLARVLPASPNLIATSRASLDWLRGIGNSPELVEPIEVVVRVGLITGVYRLGAVLHGEEERTAYAPHSTPIRICTPVEVFSDDEPPP